VIAQTAEDIERGYNNRAAVPDHPQWFARWARDSADVRARPACRLDLRYGDGPRQTLDVFPAERPVATLLFVHGGYWRSLDKSDHSFVAPAWVRRGVGVAVMNYDLCPAVSIGRIVDEARAALAWVCMHGSGLGLRTDRILLAGHSAGGHLAAMLLATDWPARGVDPACIAGAVSISGVFDLTPLLQASMNADLRLNMADARAWSPALLEPRVDVPLLLAVGADETSEFVRQTDVMWNAWPRQRPRGMRSPVRIAQRHHFSVLPELADERTDLFQSACALIAGRAAV
jgi:arylformamidase